MKGIRVYILKVRNWFGVSINLIKSFDLINKKLCFGINKFDLIKKLLFDINNVCCEDVRKE